LNSVELKLSSVDSYFVLFGPVAVKHARERVSLRDAALWDQEGGGDGPVAPGLLNSKSSEMIALQISTHSLQIKTSGPAISFSTSSCDLPQKEQRNVSALRRMNFRLQFIT